jgi:hypothetical protein
MTRYFANYYVADPMDELSADEAHARESYFERVDGPPAHYRYVAGGLVERVVYPDEAAPDAVRSGHQRAYPGVPLDVTSPLVTTDRRRWRRWSFDAAGELVSTVEYERALDGPDVQAIVLDPAGAVVTSSEYRHDAAGELVEVVHRDAAGRVTGRETMD